MKDYAFEMKLVAANPYSDHTNNFVTQTMDKIRLRSQGRAGMPKKTGFVIWLGHLQKPVLAMLLLAAMLLISGVVYAVVQFAPALLKITGKETTSRGTTEYTVAGFKACAGTNQLPTDKFEVNSALKPVSDDEITKILQAKCELQWIDGFVRSTWPSYGTNPEWKDGDAIYYTRTDILGQLVEASQNNARITYGGETKDNQPVEGEKIKAYAGGSEIPISQVKPDDTVFTIVRVTETYHDRTTPLWNKKNNVVYEAPENNPKVLGTVALFKLSLPRDYYGKKQAYLIEVPACLGNDGEYCPNTPSIDVYPSGQGEGAANPYAKAMPDGTFRQIAGTVTELAGDTLTLKTRSGSLYKVTVGDNGFAKYNHDYAANYADLDAHLHVGSNVEVRYTQPKGADAKTVAKEQVHMVSLMLESLDPKRGSIKQY